MKWISEALPLWIRLLKREVDQLPPFSTNVYESVDLTFIPPVRRHDQQLRQNRKKSNMLFKFDKKAL
jgi:hypothetical protein